MGRKSYRKKEKNGTEYYFFRLHNAPNKPRDLYGKSVKELDKKIRDAKMEMSGTKSASNLTFGVFFKSWLYDTNLVNKKPSTKELYDSIYRIHIEKSPIVDIKMKNLKVDDIQTWYNLAHKNGTSTNSIKKINKLVAPSIRFASQTGEIIRDFSKLVIIPEDLNSNVGEIDLRPISKADQEIFEKALEGERYEALYKTALYTGMRQGELFALRWTDIDLKESVISVTKTYKVVKDIDSGEYYGVDGTPKSKAGGRIVPIPTLLTDYLKKYRSQQIETLLSYGVKFKPDMLVFHDDTFDYLNASNVRKNLKIVLTRCGLEDRRFHDLRHTYATRLFELGESAKAVQTILGHADIAVTMNTYTHVSSSAGAASANKLNSIYGGTKKETQAETGSVISIKNG